MSTEHELRVQTFAFFFLSLCRMYTGTIHIGSHSISAIETAYRDAISGVPSRRPVLEITFPSTLDSTLCPSGAAVANLFVQYLPYQPSDGSWDDEVRRSATGK